MNNGTEMESILNTYEYCMAEIKRRMAVIKLFISHDLTTGFLITDVETISLQFRKIFELIALASLVAHKDEYSKQRQSFATDWNVNGILKLIEKINPDFYPVPTKQILNNSGRPFKTENIKDGFLTKDEYYKALNTCNDMLHSNNPFSPPKNIKIFENLFPEWYSKVIKLLNHHQVQLYDSNFQIWCLMNSIPDGKIQVNLFQKIEGNPNSKGVE